MALERADFDFRMEFDRLIMLVRLGGTLEIDLEAIERTIQDAETIGPILDPTAYMRGAHNLDEQKEVLKVVAPFIRGCQKILANYGVAR